MQLNLVDNIQGLLKLVTSNNGRLFLVGGAVRDELIGHDIGDYDFEIFGIPLEELRIILKSRFDIDEVGKAFGVFKLHGLPIDISIPRRDSKTGSGHKGFDIVPDPFMSIEAAAARRDFTINSIMMDMSSGEYYDPFNGRDDLKNGVLRHTSDHFAEDPLRVLRGAQFVARYNLEAALDSIEICRNLTINDLSKERVFEELVKLLLKGKQPSLGFNFLREVNWIRFWPELEAMIGCQQEPDWHPEGDVWTHTMHALDYYAEHRANNREEDLIIGFAVLLHDVGKPSTTTIKDGRITAYRHDTDAEKYVRSFFGRITNQKTLTEGVIPLVKEHMRPEALYRVRDNASDKAVRKLAARVGNISRLIRVVRADYAARPPLSPDAPACDWLEEKAGELAVSDSRPDPIIMGRHLIKLGVESGIGMGKLLDELFSKQLDGEFQTLEDGIKIAEVMIENHRANGKIL